MTFSANQTKLNWLIRRYLSINKIPKSANISTFENLYKTGYIGQAKINHILSFYENQSRFFRKI